MKSEPSIRIPSPSPVRFRDRREAGRLLARELGGYAGPGTVVLGIPRGGVVIAAEVAGALGADMDIVLSRKLGAPGNPEFAVGSVSEDGKIFTDQATLGYLGVTREYVQEEAARQVAEIHRRVARYRGALPKAPLRGRTVIVTDDGLATGATMQAALWAVRHEDPAKVICAVPVAPDDALRRLAPDADETVCLLVPPVFRAVGLWYLSFEQVEDEEVLAILAKHAASRAKS